MALFKKIGFENAPASAERSCPDCGGALHQVSVGMHDPGINSLTYWEPSKAKGFWDKVNERPVGGVVIAMMCGKCCRIFLYGIPNE